MFDIVDLAWALVFALGYTLTGLALLVAGFYALDLLTPGRLGAHIMEARSVNAAVVASTGFVSLGAVLFTVIWTNSDSSFGANWLWTVAFGVFAIALQVGAIALLDALTPGRLRDLIVAPQFHPGVLLVAASQVAIAAVIIPSIA